MRKKAAAILLGLLLMPTAAQAEAQKAQFAFTTKGTFESFFGKMPNPPKKNILAASLSKPVQDKNFAVKLLQNKGGKLCAKRDYKRFALTHLEYHIAGQGVAVSANIVCFNG